MPIHVFLALCIKTLQKITENHSAQQLLIITTSKQIRYNHGWIIAFGTFVACYGFRGNKQYVLSLDWILIERFFERRTQERIFYLQ